MSKTPYNISGVLKVEVEFTVVSNGFEYSDVSKGQAKAISMSKEYTDVMIRAIKDAYYSFLYERDFSPDSDKYDNFGYEDFTYKILWYDIVYDEKMIRKKRIKYKDGYRTLVRDKKTGRIIGAYKNNKIDIKNGEYF